MEGKAIGGGTFAGVKTPAPQQLARVADKFIYHSGTVDQLDDMKWGLDPQHGDWIKEMSHHVGDIEPDELLEQSTPLVWMSDKPSWVAMKVARKLKKHPHDITDDEIRQHGHVAMIPRKGDHAEHIWHVGEEGLSNGEYSPVTNLKGETKKAGWTDLYEDGKSPFGVERNEYVSAQPVEPMFHLTGQDLVDFLHASGNRPKKADGGDVDGITVYQGRSKKGAKKFFNPNGHAWGTTLPETAEQFAGKSDTHYPHATPPRTETKYHGEVHKLRFDIKNPMHTDIRETLWNPEREAAKIAEAQAKGHDGLAIYHSPEKTDYVAFHPDQVQHVESYTPTPAISKEGGGPVEQDGITAYHGSPHDFDEFDTSKIGTGEGAQAYGHGLYFAQNENIAKKYRDTLAQQRNPTASINDLIGQMSKNSPESRTHKNIQWYMKQDPMLASHVDDKDIVQHIHTALNGQNPDGTVSESALDSYGKLTNKLGRDNKGHMYEVHINAHPHHMLDWDKPLSEQPHVVQQVMTPDTVEKLHAYLKHNDIKSAEPDFSNISGQRLYEFLGSKIIGAQKGDIDASQHLHSAGIKGIKYRDAGSRGANEKPTHNYVVFDHNDVAVRRKYEQGGEVDDIPDIKNPISVFPKPQRMFPEENRPAGGQYLNAKTKEDMTGHKAAQASIGIAPGGRPFFNASADAVEQTGSHGKGNATAKTNLFKQKAGWKWVDAPEGHEDTGTIVSVEHRGHHHYALNAHFPKGVDLARYENSTSEPRLRPTTKGNVTKGDQVGTISVRGKEHPVYNHVIVKAGGGPIVKRALELLSKDRTGR